MAKIIKINESTFKRLLEYVGDEEEFGRYDIENDNYEMPDDESSQLNQQLEKNSLNNNFTQTDDSLEGEQYIGRDYFDPGFYGR